MAQTGFTPILIYSSSTAAAAPAAGSLTNSTLGSELAINITDGKLFYKDNANAIQVIGWKTVPTSAGGTGLTSYTAGDLIYYASGTTLTKLAIGATGRWLGSSGTAPQWNAPAALTKTDDTNVTLTLGGSASTALLNAASLTLGWTGTLATTRGGTGLSSFTANGIVYASSTSALATGSALTFDGTNFSTTGSATATRFIPTGSTVPTNGMYLATTNEVAFSTNTNERIRVASGGNVGVGLTNPASYDKLAVNGGLSLLGTQLNLYGNADFEYVVRNAYKMQFYVNSASVVANLSITGVWTNASDARYKENIVDSQYGLSTVMALKPRAYNLIDQTDKPQIGFIAQEVLDVVPEVVESVHNSITKQERYTLAYTQLIPVLTKAMQEQQAIIQSLTERIAQLESK